jgi:hypothetical protein
MWLELTTDLAPKILEPCRRQFGVPNRVLNVPVAHVGLQSAGVVALVSQCIAASVPQHVRVRLLSFQHILLYV